MGGIEVVGGSCGEITYGEVDGTVVDGTVVDGNGCCCCCIAHCGD